MDDHGESDATLDRRDQLAEEMAELKIRTRKGDAAMKHLQRENAQRVTTASGLEIRAHHGSLEDLHRETSQPKPVMHYRRTSRVEALVHPEVRESP